MYHTEVYFITSIRYLSILLFYHGEVRVVKLLRINLDFNHHKLKIYLVL